MLLVFIVGSSPWWSDALAHKFARRLMKGHSHFRVEHVVVTGVSILSEETVLKLAKVPVRHSMFRLPFEEIEKRIAKNAWVKTARVRRRLPDTVELIVTERIPVAAVRGEQLMVLTADSIAITPSAGDWVWDLPILSPPRAARLKNGARVKDDAVLALLQQTARARAVSPEIWNNLSELYYSRNQIHALLDHPRAELIAGKGVSELAWIGLQHYLEQTNLDSAGSLTTVDMRIPGKLVVSQEAKETAEQDAG